MAGLNVTVAMTDGTLTTYMAMFLKNLMANRQQIKKLQASKAMAKQFPKGIFYLNLWPFNKPLMIVASPFTGVQVEKACLDKSPAMTGTMEIINGGSSLMTVHGDIWKKWRALFNPGFASGHMTGLAPAIIDEVVIFCRLLQEQARKDEVFQPEEFALRLTFDVISRVTFGARLHYQTQGSVLADGLRRQIYWTPYGTTANPFRRWLSPRPLIQKYITHSINRYLQRENDKLFDEPALFQQKSPKRSQSRSIISLVMDQYLSDLGETGDLSKKDFKKLVIPQLRIFLYAGHETTSSALLYCYYLLSKNPIILARVHEEHNDVFGVDFSAVHCHRIINSSPPLLNQIPYTLAVIKEVLRIFPPAASLRDGRPGLILTDEDGQQYPTENCHIWTLSLAIHHSPNVFVSAREFILERWLVEPQDLLHPAKGSCRAFEWGPRACIGQTLA